MFGPSARSTSATRRARRRVLLVTLVVAVVALIVGEVVDQVVNSGGPAQRRAAASWTAAVAPIAVASNTLVPELRRLRFAANGLSRAAFLVDLDALVEKSAADEDALIGLGLAPPRPSAARELASALTKRRDALELFARGFFLATAAPVTSATVASASGLFARAGADLVAADRAYASARHDLRGLARVLPSEGWLDSRPSWSTASMALYARDLAHLERLRARAGLSIVALSLVPAPFAITGLPHPTTTTTLPPRTTTTLSGKHEKSSATTSTTSTTTTTTTTIPPPTTTLQLPPPRAVSELLPTSSVSAIVIVENTGTAALGRVTIALSLVPSTDERSVVLAPMAVGTSRYVRISNLAVARGHHYSLVVSASAGGVVLARDEVAITVED